MTDDLLSFETNDKDLLDCSGMEDLLAFGIEKMKNPFLNNHTSTAAMFIFANESGDPNYYQEEVKEFVEKGKDIRDDVLFDYTLAEEYGYWCTKFNWHKKHKATVNPFLASLAIQRVQCLRAGARYLPVHDQKGNKYEGEVTTATPIGNRVSLVIIIPGQRSTRLWFDRDTKKPVTQHNSPLRLC